MDGVLVHLKSTSPISLMTFWDVNRFSKSSTASQGNKHTKYEMSHSSEVSEGAKGTFHKVSEVKQDEEWKISET